MEVEVEGKRLLMMLGTHDEVHSEPSLLALGDSNGTLQGRRTPVAAQDVLLRVMARSRLS